MFWIVLPCKCVNTIWYSTYTDDDYNNIFSGRIVITVQLLWGNIKSLWKYQTIYCKPPFNILYTRSISVLKQDTTLMWKCERKQNKNLTRTYTFKWNQFRDIQLRSCLIAATPQRTRERRRIESRASAETQPNQAALLLDPMPT